MTSQDCKPPTQIASVDGIPPKPVTMNEPAANIPWELLCNQPPFQMYAAERMPNTKGSDSYAHAKAFVGAHDIGLDVYNDYCQWHKDKGYWPNETPMGELIAADGDTLIA